MKHIRKARKHTTRVTNTQKDIKDALEAADAILKNMVGTRELLKGARLNSMDRACIGLDRSGKPQVGSIVTPEASENRKRAVDTPTPPESNPSRPKRKAPKGDPDSWTEVTSRKNRLRTTTAPCTSVMMAVGKSAKPRRKIRPDAVIIKPGQGLKYGEVLKSIRNNIKPEDFGVNVKNIRETRAGDVLVELSATAEDGSKFGAKIGETIGGSGVVRQLVPRTTLLIRDLDAVSNEGEIRAALLNALGKTPVGAMKISLSNGNRWVDSWHSSI